METGHTTWDPDFSHGPNSTNGTILPTADPLDYAEIIVLCVMVLIGAPMNVISFAKTVNFCRRRYCCCVSLCPKHPKKPFRKPKGDNGKPKKRSASSRSMLLKMHLMAANLFIILVYGVSQIAWLATYSWEGGDFMCRVTKFFDTFCFYSTSNIVVLIAIERVSVAVFIDQPRIVAKYKEKLRVAVWIPWILAGLCSLPQLYIWHVFAPYGDDYPDWKQCITIWMAWKSTADPESPAFAVISFQETMYSGLHLVLVFWLPALIVIASYAVILIRFHLHIRKSTMEARRTQTAATVAQFRKRAASIHRSTTGMSPPQSSCEPDSTTSAPNPDSSKFLLAQPVLPVQQFSSVATISDHQHHHQASAGILAEVPIILDSSQMLFLQPTFTNVAVQTLTKAKRRTMKTTAWILFAYIACWTPYNTLELWRYLDPTVENRYLELLSNLIIVNAVVNPLIYKM